MWYHAVCNFLLAAYIFLWKSIMRGMACLSHPFKTPSPLIALPVTSPAVSVSATAVIQKGARSFLKAIIIPVFKAIYHRVWDICDIISWYTSRQMRRIAKSLHPIHEIAREYTSRGMALIARVFRRTPPIHLPIHRADYDFLQFKKEHEGPMEWVIYVRPSVNTPATETAITEVQSNPCPPASRVDCASSNAPTSEASSSLPSNFDSIFTPSTSYLNSPSIYSSPPSSISSLSRFPGHLSLEVDLKSEDVNIDMDMDISDVKFQGGAPTARPLSLSGILEDSEKLRRCSRTTSVYTFTALPFLSSPTIEDSDSDLISTGTTSVNDFDRPGATPRPPDLVSASGDTLFLSLHASDVPVLENFPSNPTSVSVSPSSSSVRSLVRRLSQGNVMSAKDNSTSISEPGYSSIQSSPVPSPDDGPMFVPALAKLRHDLGVFSSLGPPGIKNSSSKANRSARVMASPSGLAINVKNSGSDLIPLDLGVRTSLEASKDTCTILEPCSDIVECPRSYSPDPSCRVSWVVSPVSPMVSPVTEDSSSSVPSLASSPSTGDEGIGGGLQTPNNISGRHSRRVGLYGSLPRHRFSNAPKRTSTTSTLSCDCLPVVMPPRAVAREPRSRRISLYGGLPRQWSSNASDSISGTPGDEYPSLEARTRAIVRERHRARAIYFAQRDSNQGPGLRTLMLPMRVAARNSTDTSRPPPAPAWGVPF
ncbi:hypothetical protein BDZ97DRAFT_1753362 [Flammula alnicola]|nr:hypothetical protein BDZ97DRAFT_1753362 [Flammula alnicola]